MHPVDGATYLIGRGATDKILIDLKCTAEQYSSSANLIPLSLCPNQKGDLNNSGDSDILDVILMNKYILGVQELSESALPAADMDGNNEIDSTDSLMLLKDILEIQ